MQIYQALLTRLALALDRAAVPYMVIGGQAVLLHGEPRLTRDIDVTLGCDIDELPRILSITETAGLRPSVDAIQDFVRKTNVLPLLDHMTGIRVDLIFSFSPYERDAIRRAILVPFGDVQVHFAAVEDLIIHKLVAGRPRDIDDVRGILARKPLIDEKYLRTCLATFHVVVHRDLEAEYVQLRGAQAP
jgi:hypothetical protein